MKTFEIPIKYKSSIISRIKNLRKADDPRKNDFRPTVLNFGPVEFLIARHFGFCYGVENAIEIAYKTIEENQGKRIFLLSEMIHNPGVNEDLLSRGVKFIMDTEGNQLIDWGELSSNDIVIVPAFGTSIEIEEKLQHIGIDSYQYNTTCPFVEKVWNRASSLGKNDHTIIIHGKHKHEETRATFSHSSQNAPSVIVRDINETKFLGDVILGNKSKEEFYKYFDGKYSVGFDTEKHLQKVGVVNQTTMLASETEDIADYIKNSMIEKFGIENIKAHYADTRDTLCYATNDNQNATYGLMEEDVDIAIVVGGYNSSNTSHLVELLEQKFKTYFISSSHKIISKNMIRYFNLKTKTEQTSSDFIPNKDKVRIAVTSGASCPDAVVDDVLNRILSFFDVTNNIEEVLTMI
jgi:4-hydroxy-3-methylbut-2-enyl diphosphate reductase